MSLQWYQHWSPGTQCRHRPAQSWLQLAAANPGCSPTSHGKGGVPGCGMPSWMCWLSLWVAGANRWLWLWQRLVWGPEGEQLDVSSVLGPHDKCSPGHQSWECNKWELWGIALCSRAWDANPEILWIAWCPTLKRYRWSKRCKCDSHPPIFPTASCRHSGEIWAGRGKTKGGLKIEWSDGICIFRHFQNSVDQGPTSGLYSQSPWGQNYSVKWERVQKTGTEKTQLQENAPHSAESSSTCFLLKKAQEIWLLCTSTLIVRKYHVLTSFYSSQKRQNKNQWLEIKSQTTLHKKYHIHLLSNAD